MGLFDQISKKAIETVQGAKEKTNKISSEMKLKSKLSDKKDKINLLYNEIGKEIYLNYTKGIENVSQTILEKCKEITNINDEVNAINIELLEIKNIKICVSCGSKIEKNSEFCPNCGVKQVTVIKNAPDVAQETVVTYETSEVQEEQNNRKRR